MSQGWVVCSVCAKSFVPRFSYQTDAKTGDDPRFFCSQACRMPELRASNGLPSAPQAGFHACVVCSSRFQLRFAYQVVTLDKERRVVCSEACKAAFLAPIKVARASVRHIPRTIAVMNQKGGTGKTTTSVSIAAGLAERGHPTLLVDLDAQGNVGVSLGIKGNQTLYHVLIDGAPPLDAAIPVRKGLDVLCSDQTLAAAELELVNAKDRAHLLSRRFASLLAPDGPYQYIVLDCAPSLSLLNQNALTFAREVIVPVSCDYLALVGVKQILRTLRHVNEVLLHAVEVLGVLPTFYDMRNKISREAVEALKGYFKDRVLPPIRVNAKLKEAPSHKQTIFEYAPDSHGALDYAAVADWIAKSPPPSRLDAELALAPAVARAEGQSHG